MTSESPSDEALAQAREQLPVASIAAQSGDKTAARLVRELFEIYDSMRVAKRFRKTGRHPRDQ